MFAVVRVPDFPLAAVLWRREENPPPPRAVAVRADRKSVLACVDDVARARGIVPGMSTARALARCGSLSVLEKDPAAEQSAMGWLIALGFGISPRVEATEAGCVTIDLRGTGNPEKRMARVEEESAEEGIPVRIGISNTPERAAWASFGRAMVCRAETDEGLFEGLAPHEVPLPEEIKRSLQEWGICDLLGFLRLGKENVGRRLGPEGVALWDAMKGRSARLLRFIEDEPSFAAEIELEPSIETLDQALFVLRRLLGELCASLRAAGRVARLLILCWRTEAKEEHRQEFLLPEATARMDPLFAMMESHLAGVRTAAALNWIGLSAEPSEPLPEQRDFFEVSTRSPFRFQETVGRIQGLLGEERVGMPVCRESHHPDAFIMESAPPQFRIEEQTAVYARAPGPALRRFRPPKPVKVWCREGRPIRCVERHRADSIHSARGPWRISGDWWDPQYRWSREEWDVEWGRNHYCRLFRQPDGQWFWEGVYD